jgi:hypothetical protein
MPAERRLDLLAKRVAARNPSTLKSRRGEFDCLFSEVILEHRSIGGLPQRFVDK